MTVKGYPFYVCQESTRAREIVDSGAICVTKLELSCLALWTSAHPKSGCQETIFNVLGIHRFKMYTDAFERKLGPIYEAIDAQKYKVTHALILCRDSLIDTH